MGTNAHKNVNARSLLSCLTGCSGVPEHEMCARGHRQESRRPGAVRRADTDTHRDRSVRGPAVWHLRHLQEMVNGNARISLPRASIPR